MRGRSIGMLLRGITGQFQAWIGDEGDRTSNKGTWPWMAPAGFETTTQCAGDLRQCGAYTAQLPGSEFLMFVHDNSYTVTHNLINSVKKNPSWEANSRSASKSSVFCGIRRWAQSWARLIQPTSSHPIPSRSILKLSSYLCLVQVTSYFQVSDQHFTYISCLIRATRTVHRILLHFITLVILVRGIKLLSKTHETYKTSYHIC
jgi:hypothetical protein